MLTAARDLVRIGWTQGTLARDTRGNPIDPRDSTAIAWCPAGAVIRVLAPGTHIYWPDRVFGHPAITAMQDVIPATYVTDWSDAPGRTLAEVLAMFERALRGEREPNKR